MCYKFVVKLKLKIGMLTLFFVMVKEFFFS